MIKKHIALALAIVSATPVHAQENSVVDEAGSISCTSIDDWRILRKLLVEDDVAARKFMYSKITPKYPGGPVCTTFEAGTRLFVMETDPLDPASACLRPAGEIWCRWAPNLVKLAAIRKARQ